MPGEYVATVLEFFSLDASYIYTNKKIKENFNYLLSLRNIEIFLSNNVPSENLRDAL